MNTVTNHLDSDLFHSLVPIREAHKDILLQRREKGETPEFHTQVMAFLAKTKQSGVYLDSDDDRWAAQSLLDYWSNVLYKANIKYPDPNLATFDPSLAPELDDSLCPYVGLNAFQPDDSYRFFGRQELINEMVTRMAERRFLVVVGPSGSGKSSVVLAGLLATLRSDPESHNQVWEILPPMVPGPNPLRNLVLVFHRQDNHKDKTSELSVNYLEKPDALLQQMALYAKPVLLVVDQFEEVFTLCMEEDERGAFNANLLTLIRTPGVNHGLILTLRTDFESHLAKIPELQEEFERSQVRLGPLNAAQLREAIEKPAEQIGLKFEDGLVDELIREVLGEPAALPLLQFSLLMLWDNRVRNRITWEAYQRIGGGRQALARSADNLYSNLIPEEQITARRILLRIVRPGESLEVTSNRVRRETLYKSGEAHDRVDRVIERLVKAHLLRLTPGESPADDRVEVAHEALVRNWPLFVEWLEEERVRLRRRLRLTAAAEQWESLGRDHEALWRGTLLTDIENFEDLNELEEAFLHESKALEKRKRTDRAAIIENYYIKPASETTQEVLELLEKSVAESKRTLRIMQVLNFMWFGVSMIFLILGFYVLFTSEEGTKRIVGVIISLVGLVGMIFRLIRDPAIRIHNAISKLMQMQTVFVSFLWEINLNETYLKSIYENEGILTQETIEETIQRIEKAMNQAQTLLEVSNIRVGDLQKSSQK